MNTVTRRGFRDARPARRAEGEYREYLPDQAAVEQVMDGEHHPYSVAEDMLSTVKHVGFELASANEKRGGRR